MGTITFADIYPGLAHQVGGRDAPANAASGGTVAQPVSKLSTAAWVGMVVLLILARVVWELSE